jgi:hypothetical protein
MKKRQKKWTKKRPPAVTVVAWTIWVLFIIRLYQFVEPLVREGVFRSGISAPLLAGAKLTPLGSAVLSSAIYLFLSLAGIVVLIGFLRVKRWSWVTLMAWTGISLTITLINYFYSQPNYLVMASDTVIAFALNQADVQRIFGIRTDQGEQLD